MLISKHESLIADTTDIRRGTIDDVVKYIRDVDVYGLDTETAGLDFVSDPILMLQLGNEHLQFVIDCRTLTTDEKLKLKTALEDPQPLKILHNAKFDYLFLRKWLDIKLTNIFDTFIAEKILHCGKENYGFSLAAVCSRYLNVTLNKSEQNRFIGLTGQPFTLSQIHYGARDVVQLLKIREHQLFQLALKQLVTVNRMEQALLPILAEIEFEGLTLDKQAWLSLSKVNTSLAKDFERKLDGILLADPMFEDCKARIQLDLFAPVEELKQSNVNWNSPTQVLKLFKRIVPEIETVSEKKIVKYRFKHPLIDQYIKFKKTGKLATAFGSDFFKYVRADGKIHTRFSQILDTGRMSSQEPNMQQIPGNNAFRNCFITEPGWVFVSSDFSSQELCVIAFGSKDPVFLEALSKNQDLHSICAELVFKEKWKDATEEGCAYEEEKKKCECSGHKKLRTWVKTINFGLAYGMGPGKLSETINCSKDEAKSLIKEYFKEFPKIKNFLDTLGEFGKRNGYIFTYDPFKRKRWFSNWTPRMYQERENFTELGSIERASKNTPIQGSGADMTKLALIYIYKEITENDLPVKLVMTVHDQIDTICKAEYAEQWKVRMTELMEKAANVILTNGLLKAETSITEKWSK